MYRLRRPAAALLPFVEHYWFVTHTDAEPVQLRVDVFVDGRADLILNHGVSYLREVIGGASQRIESSNLDAQRLVPIRIAQSGLVSIAGVRFHLGGLGVFTRSTLSTWTGLTPDPALVFGPGTSELERLLIEAEDLDEKAGLLDAFLLERLDTGGRFVDFAEALGQLVDTDGLGRPGGLSATDRRDRARLFARYLGIPPRTTGRILRFQRTLRALMSEPETSLAELASDAGYYDQAHFIREFRQMTGGVPRGYRGYYPPDAPTDFAPNVVAYVQDGPRESTSD